MYTVYSKVIGLRYLWDTLAVSINDLNRAGEEEELRNKGEVKGLLLQDVLCPYRSAIELIETYSIRFALKIGWYSGS